MGVTIITDSGSDLAASEASRAGIDIVPVYILADGQRLRDGVEADRDSVIAKIAAGSAVSTQPPEQEDFAQAFTRATASGNDVVMVTLSSHLSESNARASAAAAAFNGRVHVVDSRGASGMEALLVLYAAELAKSGVPAAEIARRVNPASVKAAQFFAVPDISILGRSGRLPKAIVALGSMLNVSLVLKVNDQGAIGPAGQSFSFEKTCEIMVEAVVRAIERSPNARIAFSHVRAGEVVAKLSRQLTERLGYPPAVEIVHEAPPTLVANIGTGAIGISAIVP
jgi:DegV family protein with EDD domain